MGGEPIGRVDHIAFAVRSIEQARAFFEGALGATLRRITDSRDGSFRFAVLDFEGVTLELLEPLDPKGFVAQFLEKRGEGFHHITLQVPHLAQKVQKLEAQGIRIVGKELEDPGWLEAFISPKSACGVLFQLAETCPPLDNEPYPKLKGGPRMDLSTVDHLLTTTRSVRKRLDFSRPVEPEVIEKCIEIALQAPTGSNMQNWHFVVVTDPQKKAALADLYRKAFSFYTNRPPDQMPRYDEGDPRARQMPRILDSATYLAQHLQEAPALVLACMEGRVEKEPPWAQASAYGSVLPAAWSFMLALRARGLGTTWTTLHLLHEEEAAQILGLPDSVTQTVLFPVAYFKGEDFKPAKRLPAQNFIHWNGWGQKR